MFEELAHQQNIADQLKGLMNKHGRTPSQRMNKQAAMDILHMFERGQWHRAVFEDALNEVAPGVFGWDGKALQYTPNEGTIFEVVLAVLSRYLVLMDELNQPTPPDWMTTAEAALYLGVSERTVRKHIYETKKLKGTMKGNSLVFSRAELDEFQAGLRPYPRNRKEEE